MKFDNYIKGKVEEMRQMYIDEEIIDYVEKAMNRVAVCVALEFKEKYLISQYPPEGMGTKMMREGTHGGYTGVARDLMF